MSTDLADVVRARLAAEPEVSKLNIDISGLRAWEMRLLCTKGHFIQAVAVINLDDHLVLLSPLDKNRQFDPEEPIYDLIEAALRRPPRGTAGLLKQTSDRIGTYHRVELVLECPRKRCSYSGSFEYFGLAADLGTAAASGHAEYQLTN
ncbi:hypothetical protein ACN27E_07840 [Mycobacterium sp. WMMD1722]|uniref:hypothetical protein n=1 Tax=Mycobacterium sp. WMMD1722 TaxID=3404117 RepID=UPI003BF5EAEB